MQTAPLRPGRQHATARAHTTVFISEGDRTIRDLLIEVFHDAGYRTYVVGPDLASAQRIMAAGADIVLLDVTHARAEETIALLSQMRHTPHTADVPVVLLTTDPHVGEALERAREASGCPVILKPFQVAELLWTVENSLRTP